ncbi:MAG: CheR family methyltransferase [Coriobacteriales bacterium]|nr:CheR family methyltransferase [Coriobacteriales bacterium]
MSFIKLTKGEVEQVAAFMSEVCGNDFSGKEYLISSKMGLLCQQEGFLHFYDFWDSVRGHTMEAARRRQQVIDALTTNYSYFFREDQHFARLSELIGSGILPVVPGKLRVWSVGCATGEEPYNIAMALEDCRRMGQLPFGYKIVASDISSKAIAIAEKGRYSLDDYARLPPAWRKRYCGRAGDGCEVSQLLRANVEFRLENVLEPRPDAPFDLVWCRNMIIYFNSHAIKRLCSLLKGLVKPGGYLFFGHAEVLEGVSGFTYVEPSLWRRNQLPVG